jgi:hypothetical protein
MDKCLICHRNIKDGPYCVCYDPDWKINVWGGDSHRYVGYLCNKCGKKLQKEANKQEGLR